MGNNNAKIIIWSILGVIVLGIFAFIYWLNTLQSWIPNYEPETDEPYGSIVFQRYLKKKLGEDISFIELEESPAKTEAFNQDNKGLYVFIGRSAYQDSSEISALLNYVAEGNQALFMCEDLPRDFMMTLFYPEFYKQERLDKWEAYRKRINKEASDDEEDEQILEGAELEPYFDDLLSTPEEKTWRDIDDFIQFRWDTTIHFTYSYGLASTNALKPSLDFSYVSHHETSFMNWAFFNPKVLAESPQKHELMGEHRYGNYMIRVPHGEGEIFLNCVPLLGGNYSLLREDVFEFTNHYTSALKGDHLIWDNYSREARWIRDETTGGRTRSSAQTPEIKDGPLSFILSEPALKWAWFLLLALTFLYLILGARRKQRAIPVVLPPKNTSVEYAETLGHMFRQKNEHHRLMKMQGELFNSFVRERYGIKLNMQKDQNHNEANITLLAQKSDYSKDIIQEIFHLSTLAQKGQGSEPSLVRLYQLLEDFYANCK